MKVCVAFAVCVAAVPSVAGAQAFGVRMGAPASQYHAVPAGNGENRSLVKISVPEPNGEFETYLAVATASTGVCKVIAVGRTHTNDEFGSDVTSTFSKFRDTLNGRYGKSVDFSFLRSGAIWTQPREWVWSIYKKERILASFWSGSNGSSLPATVEGIALEAKSVNPSSGAYITLSYEFANFDQCKRSMEQTDNTGL